MKQETKPTYVWINMISGKKRTSITQPSPNYRAVKAVKGGEG